MNTEAIREDAWKKSAKNIVFGFAYIVSLITVICAGYFVGGGSQNLRAALLLSVVFGGVFILSFRFLSRKLRERARQARYLHEKRIREKA